MNHFRDITKNMDPYCMTKLELDLFIVIYKNYELDLTKLLSSPSLTTVQEQERDLMLSFMCHFRQIMNRLTIQNADTIIDDLRNLRDSYHDKYEVLVKQYPDINVRPFRTFYEGDVIGYESHQRMNS